jgi:hypothetical protein
VQWLHTGHTHRVQFGRAPLRVKHTRRAANRAANASGTQSAGCGCSYGYGFRQQLQLSAAAACSTCCRLPVCAALPTAATTRQEWPSAEEGPRRAVGCGLWPWPVRPTRAVASCGSHSEPQPAASHQHFSVFGTPFSWAQGTHLHPHLGTRTRPHLHLPEPEAPKS